MQRADNYLHNMSFDVEPDDDESDEKELEAHASRWGDAASRDAKDAALQFSYGITLIDYEMMLAAQDHCCSICRVHESNFDRALAVDHCHATNRIRGLLCNRCNRGIALFESNPPLALRAYDYLTEERSKALTSVPGMVPLEKAIRLKTERSKARAKKKAAA
jgi:hypothetical protein